MKTPSAYDINKARKYIMRNKDLLNNIKDESERQKPKEYWNNSTNPTRKMKTKEEILRASFTEEEISNKDTIYQSSIQRPAIYRAMEEFASLRVEEEMKKLNKGDDVIKIAYFSGKCSRLESTNKQLQQENERLKIDRDEKEVMINAFDKIQQLFDSYEWIKEGRGPYAYNDEGYRKEVTNLYEEFEEIKSDTWNNIQTKTHEYKDALTKELTATNKQLVEALSKLSHYSFHTMVYIKSDSFRETLLEVINESKALIFSLSQPNPKE